MKLERLELRGFLRFDEPIALDLRELPAGLVAITGENGAGKTTLLDGGLAAAYLAFPSRDGKIADYATSRDAYLEALYSIEGRGAFRMRVNVDGVKRTGDAVLELVQDDGSRVPLNDGKVMTFREQVAQTFPPQELLLASAFSAQNRAGSFVSLDKRDRKDLFSTLLGLKHYEAMADTARRCLQIVIDGRSTLQTQRELLARETTPAIEEQVATRANALQAESGAAELRRIEVQAQLEELATERASLVDQAQSHLATLERVQALTSAIAAMEVELRQLARDEESARQSAARDGVRADERRTAVLAGVDIAQRREQETSQSTMEGLDARIANNRQVLEDAEAIRAAVRDRDAAIRAGDALRESEALTRTALAEAQHQVRVREQRLREVERAERDLAAARRQTETLTTVPCGGVGEYAPCRFLTDARTAQASIDALEVQVGQGLSLREGVAQWTARIGTQTHRLAELATAITDAAATVARYEPQAKLAPHIDLATERIADYERQRTAAARDLETRLADLQRQRDGADASHRETDAEIAARLTARLDAIATRRGELQLALEQQAGALDTARRESAATERAARRVVVVDASLTTARQAWTTNEAALATVAARRVELERERAAYIRKRRARDELDARLQTLGDESLTWQVLAKAFGRDGLPTLEIDAAGPTVSNLTNDLLNVCFGPRFTVELVTQEEKADGKGFKESFEIKVFDNVAGGDQRDIADLSGGERVIVEEALRAAIALFVNSRNEQPIRTCWRDETTGALDPENAVRYVAMLRRLQELGGFHHILFISHNPDATRLADTEIRVQDGRADVVRRAA